MEILSPFWIWQCHVVARRPIRHFSPVNLWLRGEVPRMSILVRLCQVKLEKQGLADKLLLFNALYTLLISLGTILNFQWMTSFAERSYTWPKWLPKMKAVLTLILQWVHINRNVFTSYQEEYFLYTMPLWVCYRNFKAFVQWYSWIDDIEAKRELI